MRWDLTVAKSLYDCAMKRIGSSSVGILQGSQTLFSDFADGGPMWTGQGDREIRRAVAFDHAFLAAPNVIVSIGMLDLDKGHNIRTDITEEHVTATGFDIVFRTWGDTRIARVRADWLAIGPTNSDDDWQL